MVVYLVIQDVPYDSSDVMAVFEDRDDALAFVAKVRADTICPPSWLYRIDEMVLRPKGTVGTVPNVC